MYSKWRTDISPPFFSEDRLHVNVHEGGFLSFTLASAPEGCGSCILKRLDLFQIRLVLQLDIADIDVILHVQKIFLC